MRELQQTEISGTSKKKDEIINLKKELKVLRRERDHYGDIIKKNKLL